MNGVAIAVRNVEKRFGRLRALSGVSIDVPAGSALAVLGPNGAGKSTLLRLMAGLARPSDGTVCVGEHPADRPAARARVGLVGHATFLYATLTARENLVFAGRMHGVRDPVARADELLAIEGLTPVANRAAAAFSRGMAQRLSIARGLVHDPAVLLLDEPFTGLDRRSADRLAARLVELRSQGRTVVMVTHDVRRGAAVADRAVVLSRGRIAHASADGGLLDAETLEAAVATADDGLA